MIGGISSHGFHHQLSSSPAVNVSAQTPIDAQDNESTSNSPVPSDSQKVNATVSSQESQVSKRRSNGRDDTGANLSEQKITPKPRARAEKESPTQLDETELKQVQKLKQRDIEVRAHEAAHLAAAGQYAQGGAKFTLARGPDGRSYATGGSVSIDTSPEASPEATIRKADQIRRAALAPAEPSGPDRAVAASAAKLKLEAQTELADERRAKPETGEEEKPIESSGSVVTPSVETLKEAFPEDTKSSPSAEKEVNAESQPTCAVCGGAHPTGPHLQANLRKTDQYLSPIQGRDSQLNRVA